MSEINLDQLVRRLIAGAFDAGVAAASRPAATRNAAREDQVGYAGTILAANLDAAVTRRAQGAARHLAAEPDATRAQDPA